MNDSADQKGPPGSRPSTSGTGNSSPAGTGNPSFGTGGPHFGSPAGKGGSASDNGKQANVGPFPNEKSGAPAWVPAPIGPAPKGAPGWQSANPNRMTPTALPPVYTRLE